jgi:selenocysteine lyase/cysteine desulfurase
VLERAHPQTVGWLSVRDPFAFDGQLDFPDTAARYEAGTENLLDIVGLGAAIDLIDRLDAEWIEQRILGLTDHLCDGLEQRGFRLISERSRTTSSGIVVFAHRRIPTPILHQRLTDAGVRCSVRGGGIRFSPHHYNTVEEIDAALGVFAT